ncbi:MAG: 1-acyl-sn-glycerol-3-phosphate acyltransferase [Muribaculaceae bacterium]|nr:glycerol acyltransferase [Bacteroides sp.]MDE6803963.1 1-acyl-sn-glycerol-3-phosphate acyltransferase [Muribaculaceae bacterium]
MEEKKQRELLKLDLHDILRRRVGGWKGRLIPGALISALERLIRQDRLNELLEIAYPAEGSAFSAAILKELDITVTVEGTDNIPAGKRLIFASNHPLGGLDGITLIKVLGDMYGDDHIRFLVNDMLMNVEPLQNVFLPINKYGSQGREAAKAINVAYASDMQIAVFPAGLVSRLHDDGTVADLMWQKAFVAKAIEYRRDIVPVRFVALNTPHFYRFARRRKRIGLKVNLEQALLPSEVCKAQGAKFRIIFGNPVSWESLRDSRQSPLRLAADLRAAVYSLEEPERIGS